VTSIPNTSGIYRITNTINGKFYIGSAVNLRVRWNLHRSALLHKVHGNPKLQNAWNKYGPDAFTFEVLELVLLPFLIEREQYWLDTLKPFGKNGYNIARVAGSRLGLKASPETCKKISVAKQGKQPWLGRTHRLESNEKNRLAHLGKPTHNRGKKMSPETLAKNIANNIVNRKTLIVFSPDGTEYRVTGIRQFCREHSLNPSHLSEVARGKQSNHKGWIARFPDELQ